MSLFLIQGLFAQENRIDIIRPDAPELAQFGPYTVGVRSFALLHKDQIDVINIKEGEPLPRYDRPLNIEIWYPADTDKKGGKYDNVYLRDGETKVTLYGSAVRNADALKDENKFPLIIISHGYPGNRFLMSHMGENLASKGYVVVSIDHTDSTYENRAAFASTLLNRPYDQKFVLDEMVRMTNDKNHFLYGLIDTENTGLIGYSMGGYGAIITAGGGITEKNATNESFSPQNVLKKVMTGSKEHENLIDDRFKAIVAIAPWGMTTGFWDVEGLRNVRKPIFFISGSIDSTSGYEEGTRKIFAEVVNTDRYLLTFENANHNAIAPIPAPKEAWTAYYGEGSVAFTHYSDPVWETVRANNIADHFLTAYFGKILKQNPAMDDYLNLIESPAEGVFSDEKEKHTYWKGFKNQKAAGLHLEFLAKD